MIDDLNEALRELLKRELPVKNGEVEIAFEQPKREWSARLSRPTLNIFLYEMQENTKLRQQPSWGVTGRSNGIATQAREPLRMDLRYMITAWATEAEDEYRLLGRSLMAFSRFDTIPEELLPDSLQNQPVGIPLEIAQPSTLQNATDLWSVLDNEMKPALACSITLAVTPHLPTETPIVRTRELSVNRFDPFDPDPPLSRQYWTVGGRIITDKSLDDISVKLLERDATVHLQEEGRFAIGNLAAGEYTLEITVKGRKKARQQKITVPSPDYEIKI
ncbi:MAG: Pvc16 family protein [Chloroflexota bacterium]